MSAMPASQAPDVSSIPPEHRAHGAELVAEGADGGGCMADLEGRAGPARLLLVEDDRDIVTMLEARLQRARRLLLDTDLMVKSIAPEVGYRQTSELTRAMAARFVATPTALRAGSRGPAPDEDA